MRDSNLKIISGNSNRPLAEAICQFIGVPLTDTEVTTFPDGESFVKINENIRGRDVFLVQSSCPPVNDNLIELLIMIDAARRASASRITAVIPFYGYARQDRKDQPRVPITAKLVANLLTSAGADRVLTVDLHAGQIQGFFDIPVDHLLAFPVLYDHIVKKELRNLVVMSPDVGGVKMADAYAREFKCGLGFVAKKRHSATQVEATSIVGDVKGCDVLLIDDMTETAGTICAAARLIKSHGARRILAAVTHANLQDMGYERLKEGPIEELVVTDTIPVDPKGLPIKVLSVAPLLGEAILRISNNESVTSLFRVKGF
ncbi:ribose-phosphate pyrophosphokinase [Pelagicoccus sp. NFK12]|uniref:Ribose-phosphate pyrophosphokinase n=1 Tax=Pelagicoccus enzymogenes TaxID=2773457 RepID=A0A927F5E6_9BACT|nr:ribose-phosphate pyrophosphokinase [Pelagicoccus enzymogenes]MBD5778204.1 ribose-phosphate pyrophosphokinase [Pelagicoccus enzymogenes]